MLFRLDVHTQVAGALRKLACNAINKVTIVGTGGLTALYSAMDAWPSNAAIQYQCVNALRSLASNYSPQNKVIIFDGGGVPRVLRAMDVHSTVPKVSTLPLFLFCCRLCTLCWPHRCRKRRVGS